MRRQRRRRQIHFRHRGQDNRQGRNAHKLWLRGPAGDFMRIGAALLELDAHVASLTGSMPVYFAPHDQGHTWVSAGMGGCYSACTACGYTCDEGCKIDEVARRCIHPPCPGVKVDWYNDPWFAEPRAARRAALAAGGLDRGRPADPFTPSDSPRAHCVGSALGESEEARLNALGFVMGVSVNIAWPDEPPEDK